MPRPRKDEARDTRELALSAAKALLHEHGYLGLSLDAVAAAVGVRKASLYHHFPDGKQGLVLEIADREIEHDARGFQGAIGASDTARGQLEGIARFALGERRETGRVLRDARRFMAEEHRRRIFETFYREEYLRVLGVMEAGVARGELRPHDTGRSAWAFLGLVGDTSEPDGLEPTDSLAAWIVEVLVDGLGAPPEA